MTEAHSTAIVVFDIDGVIRDVAGSYCRALADTVAYFTAGTYRPSLAEIDALKSEGIWNNDWAASEELIYRFFEAQGQSRSTTNLDYQAIVTFFQSRYRGSPAGSWTGYIQNEPLLLHPAYLVNLTRSGLAWGFFSGATRASATYVLETRLGLEAPVLVAMEDAPSKPDPAGLLEAVCRLEAQDKLRTNSPVFYVGDTVADLYTVRQAQTSCRSRSWIGIGILPPHVQDRAGYSTGLIQAGAAVVFDNVEQLTPERIMKLVSGQ